MQFLENPEYKILIAIVAFTLFLFAKKAFEIVTRFLLHKAIKNPNSYVRETFESIQKPLSFLFILLGIKTVSIILGTPDEIKEYLVPLNKSLLAFVIFWILYNCLSPLSLILSTITHKFGQELSDDITRLLIKALKFLVISIGFVSIMNVWGYNISGFLASLGLVGMALALAAKETASNLFGSLVIFTDKPFVVGDWIKTPDVEGFVEEIGIRSTKIRTFAQAVVTMPNATLANSAILNWTRMGKRRIKMNIGLTYSTTSLQMQNIVKQIRQMLENHQDIHQETIHIYFTDFQDSSLGIFCYFFTKSTVWGEHMRVQEDTNLKIMKIVEDNGASFAFPSRSIYIENNQQNQNTNMNQLD